MNDRHVNPDEPSFVFKTSKLKVSIALSRGDEEHFLSNECCHIDGNGIVAKIYNCHLERLPSCFTQASVSFHNGMRGRNSSVTPNFSPLSTKQSKKLFQVEFLIQLLSSWPMKLVDFSKG